MRLGGGGDRRHKSGAICPPGHSCRLASRHGHSSAPLVAVAVGLPAVPSLPCVSGPADARRHTLAPSLQPTGPSSASNVSLVPCSLPCRTADLNPNNVLLKSDMSARAYCQPKVADFGLSVLLPEHRTHLSNLRVGTPFYMAPEVVTQVRV